MSTETSNTLQSVARGDEELGTWQQLVLRPSPPMRGLVENLHGYRQNSPTPAVHRALPMPGVPIIITLGAKHRIRDADGREVCRGSFVAGPHSRHVFVESDAFVGLQVDLTPLGAFRLLGRPLRELAGQVVELADVLGRDAERLVDDLACEPDWGGRLRLLESVLSARLACGAAPTREVTWAWQQLERTGGQIPVGRLADELGWSRRHLAARFGEQLGLSPKRAARLIRFHRAIGLLERPGGPDLASVAHLAGYYDQAHLTNEVRAHCGLTPLEHRRSVLTGDGGEPAGA